MRSRVAADLKAWRELAQRHLPGWRPTLQGLQRLDDGPRELGVALRSIARGWDANDARWDVLMAVLEYSKREHAHRLAQQQRAVDFDWYEEDATGAVMARDHLADLIDPKAQRAATEGDKP